MLAAALTSPGDADDVLQDASVIALRTFERFEEGTSFAAWMGQIVRNVASNERRARARRSSRQRDIELMGVVDPRTSESDDGFDDRTARALLGLDETARTSLLLHVVGGMKHREIGELLELPEGTVASHVHRARQALRKELGDGGENASGDAPNVRVNGRAALTQDTGTSHGR